ncbi:MAG: hypothetical protein SPL15_00400 [Lachnospiraceae bacterium]|nr:hypothetical protein [Lachnospiraceae bacterium]MDY5741449.1 hypothetical protein [Lachnospiraceae bacterium]
MSEKVYKSIGLSGALNIALGVITIVVGLTTGVLMIVSGAKLLRDKMNLTF